MPRSGSEIWSSCKQFFTFTDMIFCDLLFFCSPLPQTIALYFCRESSTCDLFHLSCIDFCSAFWQLFLFPESYNSCRVLFCNFSAHPFKTCNLHHCFKSSQNFSPHHLPVPTLSRYWSQRHHLDTTIFPFLSYHKNLLSLQSLPSSQHTNLSYTIWSWLTWSEKFISWKAFSGEIGIWWSWICHWDHSIELQYFAFVCFRNDSDPHSQWTSFERLQTFLARFLGQFGILILGYLISLSIVLIAKFNIHTISLTSKIFNF